MNTKKPFPTSCGLFELDTTWTDDYVLQIKASPITNRIAQLYANIASGIEQEIINNMPIPSIERLLVQLTEAYLIKKEHSRAKEEVYRLREKLREEGY